MGDNGLLEGEHGMVDKRTDARAEHSHPAAGALSGPGADGKVVEQQVLHVDVAPSLLELCGAPPLDNIHGRSWVKLVRKGDPPWRNRGSMNTTTRSNFRTRPTSAASAPTDGSTCTTRTATARPTGTWPNSTTWQADPDEDKNLIGDPAYADQLSQLKQDLERRMQETGLTAATDRMPLDEGIKQTLPDQKIR